MSQNDQYEFLWKKACEILQNSNSKVFYNTYIAPLHAVDIENTKLILETDTAFVAKTVTGRIEDKIFDAFRKAGTGLTNFEVRVSGTGEKYYGSETSVEEEPAATPLNPRFTFDSFVAGKSNEFVYAAAKAVAENPSENFNPLYIYGASGLGKTHLLQSIANYLSLHKPSLRVLYTTCEKFFNELIDSIYITNGGNNRDSQARFRDRYRHVDVLLIDDVQFLAGKQSAQEALFHTFNALQENNRQIVLTSDVPPKEIATLEERLRTRFEGGLIADIQPPDIETKIAILRKKAEERKVLLPSDVAEFLAKDSGTDVRTLEGRLTKVIFASKLHEEPITMELASNALRESISDEQEAVTEDKIIGAVCSYYKIPRDKLLGKSKKKDFVEPRQICAYLMCELLNIPLVNIGEALGGRDHTTVIHSRDKIANLIKLNGRVEKDVEDIRNIILKQ